MMARLKEPHGSSAKESQPVDITNDPIAASRRTSFKQYVLFEFLESPILRSLRKFSAPKHCDLLRYYSHDVRGRTLLCDMDAIAFTQN